MEKDSIKADKEGKIGLILSNSFVSCGPEGKHFTPGTGRTSKVILEAKRYDIGEKPKKTANTPSRVGGRPSQGTTGNGYGFRNPGLRFLFVFAWPWSDLFPRVDRLFSGSPINPQFILGKLGCIRYVNTFNSVFTHKVEKFTRGKGNDTMYRVFK